MSRLPLARRLAYAALALLLLVGAGEGLARLLMPSMRRVTLPNESIRVHLEGASFRYDPDLGWYWADPGGAGSPVNSYGFVRAEAMTLAKPAGTTRVITFGDSQTFGAGVGPDHTYSAFAEAALGDDWEVLDAGISGYRTLNAYRLMRLKMLSFAPDAFVVDCMPFDSALDDGTLEGTPTVRSVTDRVRGVLWYSRLYYVLRLGMEVFDPNRPRWLDHPPEPGKQLTRDEVRLNSPGNHALIAEWGNAHGIEVFFMEYPIMDEQGNHGCMTQPGELPETGRIIHTCELLAATGRPAAELFQDRNHLTIEGNRLVGGIVADAIREWRPQ